ncbi:MAG: type II and III secretion system protein [Candidatus Cloacimonetes bacterium]|nr:type II and III secretion system protein [Candidatus Cloacimonadota bacterium]
MKKITIIIFVLFFAFSHMTIANEIIDEKVTIYRNTEFPKAINILDRIAEKYEDKRIINQTAIKAPIELPITGMNWKEALGLLAKYHELQIEELPSSYIIKSKEEVLDEDKGELKQIINKKQVRINAIFFKVDKSFLKSVGIDWSTLIQGEVEASVDFKGGSKVASDIFEATGSTRLENGDMKIDINTLLRIIESHELGTVIAKPNIVVISGEKGNIQVGDDFSVKTVDEAGNVTDEFFSTGIIMDVTPQVITQDDNECVFMEARVEKSSATPGEVSTIVHKSQSETKLLLFDGEETVIAGLYDTDYTTTRSGIPILKDLPWWVFGIRYLTGYNQRQKSISELIIILKAEIIDPLDKSRKRNITLDEQRTKNKEFGNRADEIHKKVEEEYNE